MLAGNDAGRYLGAQVLAVPFIKQVLLHYGSNWIGHDFTKSGPSGAACERTGQDSFGLNDQFWIT